MTAKLSVRSAVSPMSAKSTAVNSGASVKSKPCFLSRHTARLAKVKEINRSMWAKDVITDDERFSKKASCASLRAQKELADTCSYFEASRKDTVG